MCSLRRGFGAAGRGCALGELRGSTPIPPSLSFSMTDVLSMGTLFQLQMGVSVWGLVLPRDKSPLCRPREQECL